MDRRWPILIAVLALGLLVGLGVALHNGRPHRAHAAATGHRHPAHHISVGAVARRNARTDARVIRRLLRHPVAIRSGTRHRREIALTFDDGPTRYTRGMVRMLRRLRAPGTFFTIGLQLPRYPAAIAAEVRAGFPVGDHTVNHPRLAPMPGPGQRREIRGQARRLRRLGAPWPRLFRPPYGSYDRTTLGITRTLGMVVVLWTVDSRDYLRPGRKAIIRTVVAGARPGAIVLLHDGGGDRSQTIAALPGIVRRLRRRGYRLVTVPQLLRPLGMPLGSGWMSGR
jgi:peptidoglycan/xylan/chitin deacetylase (PgdA/CDA1 family)